MAPGQPACDDGDDNASAAAAIAVHKPRYYRELEDEAAFLSVADDEGQISIGGFGSLLSERSARETFPHLRNFRKARLRGFRRIFAHVAPVFFENGVANMETKEIASLSVEEVDDVNASLIITVFEIEVKEVPAFIEREHEFRFLVVYPEVVVEGEEEREVEGEGEEGHVAEEKARKEEEEEKEEDAKKKEGEGEGGGEEERGRGRIGPRPAVVCARWDDESYRRIRCQDDEEYYRLYGRHGVDRVWRDDVFPCRAYLRHCVIAARNLGADAYDSFLDNTYLADRVTSIRSHLASNPEIMDELPPPEMRTRYGG
ncbi:hypothetical protein CBR_g37153 [Chara braunii]|uniref:Uncharacterized protein n=1 Tax=Chara braunii TaxID=69332 RepID=A0A388LMF5_CHABU|nr:hypothetical protein CBR_g37153 [Chara braunii]|eukprot:GBG83441.1 hypothetical protein CBR_g37153 [Chara braunii]